MEAMSTVGNERLAAVVGDVLSALHEVLERHQVTEQEWMAALAFLTEVGRADEFVLLSDVTRTSVLIDALSHARRRRRDGERRRGPAVRRGPAGPRGQPGEDLRGVRGDGRRRRAADRRHGHLDGRRPAARRGRRRLADRPGRRLRHLGRAPARDELPRQDPARPRTAATRSRPCSPSRTRCRPTARSGRYLEAVGQHAWRPAHIHFKVSAPGHRTLVTQVFFPDDPYLENDTIGAVKPALVRPVERRGEHLGCDFDIALAPAG